MLNTNDKKGIAVVILLLIIILGSLVFIRGCNRKEFVEEDVLNLPEEVVPDGGYDPSQSSDSNIDNTDTVYSNSKTQAKEAWYDNNNNSIVEYNSSHIFAGIGK